MQITLELSDNTEKSLKELAEMLGMTMKDFIEMRLRQEGERGYQRLLDARDRAEEFNRRWTELHQDIKGPVLSDEAMSRKNLIRDAE